MIGQTISHYTILEKLGEGGMGVVYKAHDDRLDRDVALKFLPPGLTGEADLRERFIHEARAVSALEHPNICNVHEIGETADGRSFIVMAYYSGETLRTRIARGPLPWREAVEIALQAGRGLQRAHEQGIIHRDIKPANIIITDHDEVKVVDFGLAKLAGAAKLTRPGTTAGTTAYMSPEQLRGDPVDHRSDIWSLGVLLHEMLAGSRPFGGEYAEAMMYAILNTDPAPLPAGTLPGGLERIVGKMLSRDREDRYGSMENVIADLTRVAAGGPAESTTFSTGGVDPVRKRKFFIASVAVTILAVAVALVIMVTSTSTRILPLEPSEFILVGDFINRTTDPVFDHSLTEAVRVSLRQSSLFNILPTERVAEALERMKLPASQPIDDTTAVGIAQREGVRAVITGSIARLGSAYLLTCRITDAVSVEIVNSLRREADNAENVLSAMDRLCDDIREHLGESMQEISAYSMPLEKVSTPSLKALELYSRGNILEGQSDYSGAAVLKEQAVAEDSLFAIAISDLSYIHRMLGHDSLAISYHHRVLPLLDRVTDREKYYMLSIYYGPSFELDFQKAFRSIQQLVLRYPNSPEGYATLGNFAMHTGDYKTAIDADRRSLAIDSIYAGTVFNNMGYALALSGDADGALEYFGRSRQIRPGYKAIDRYISQCYWIKEEYDSAGSRLLSILPDRAPRSRYFTYSLLVALYYYQGLLKKADETCREAVALCRSDRLPGEEAYFHYLAGEIALDRGDTASSRTEMKTAERLSVSPFLELPLIGARYAETGRLRDARRVLDRLSKLESIDPFFLNRRKDFEHFVRGAILLAGHDRANAGKEFAAVRKIQSADPYFMLAQFGLARSLAGRSDTSAIRILETLLRNRGEAVYGHLLTIRNSGPWTRVLSPGVHLELGRYSIDRNDDAAAERHLRSCLDCWRNADNQFKPAMEAKRLLAGLTKAR